MSTDMSQESLDKNHKNPNISSNIKPNISPNIKLNISSNKRQLFDSAFLAKLEQLSLHTRLVLDGTTAGNRKSRSKGSSVEFSDYREYAPGDDFRRLDWNAYGRFEKLFVKIFMEEREAPITVFLDVSKSMDWGQPNKCDASRKLAAALGYIGLSGFDRVSVVCINDSVMQICKDVRGKNFFYKLTDMLENTRFDGGSNIQKAVLESRLPAAKGITIIISDFFSDASIDETLKYLKYKKQEVHICHILSPQELQPGLSRPARLVDCETGSSLDISLSPALFKAYEKALADFRGRLEDACFKFGVNYYALSSDMRLETMVKDVAAF